MRFIDELRVLERRVSLIDRPTQSNQWAPAEVDIIETAFWARSVLEIIKDVKLREYGHSLKLSIRTTRSVSDPNHPGSAKAVYEQNKHISLKKLLEAIIHFRYFAFTRYADGNHGLSVMSDRNVMHEVYYSDFTAALQSLVLSERLVALAICDLVERDLGQRDNIPWDDTESRLFAGINLFSLLHEHVKGEPALKLGIMEKIFGITDVPDAVLPRLAFFQSVYYQDAKKMTLGFGPAWENEQSVFSPPFDQSQLFKLIRDYYVNR